jgi:hypothetical protein
MLFVVVDGDGEETSCHITTQGCPDTDYLVMISQ